MSSHLDRKCMLTTSELTQYFRYSKVVLTVFNQFDKLSGRDEISRNAFLTKVLYHLIVRFCAKTL